MDAIKRLTIMAGLIKENFNEEVLIELSWIMNVIDEITQRYGIETYETVPVSYTHLTLPTICSV